MPSRPSVRRRGPFQAAAGVAVAGLFFAGLAYPGTSAAFNAPRAAAAPAPEDDLPAFLGGDEGLEDADFRTGSVTPNAAQKSMVTSLGARVTWNRFGTPASLIKDGGYLATGLKGSDLTAARSWLRSNAALFRLTRTDVDNLELVNNSELSGGAGHAVTFRQRFGGLPATQDGMIIVGIRDGKVAYVSSSSAGSQTAPATATLSATEAWLKAAAHIGREVSPDAIGGVRKDDSWTVFPVDGFGTPKIETDNSAESIDQRARLVAFPTYTQGVKAAYEVNVLDDRAGHPVTGYILFVDAQTGKVWFRHNAVDALASASVMMAGDSGFFSGTTGTNPDPEYALCGPKIEIQVDPPIDKRIDVTATAQVPADDIVIDLYRPDGSPAAHGDTLFSPEAVDYELQASDPGGTWFALVCEYEDVENFSYEGFYTVSPVAAPDPFAFPPQWNYFPANPKLPEGPVGPPFDYPETDNRKHACWTTSDVNSPKGCQIDLTPNVGDTNLASRAPWDHNVQTNTPTFMTYGNNAETAEGWNTALTPGPFSQRPINFDRTYGFFESGDPESPTGELEDWTNEWNEHRCDYLFAQTPASNNLDVYAATTTLHAGHNRFHDFSYHLGFTERNYNLQLNNFGNTAPGPYPSGREGDPEIGDVQNGATLPAALGLTRDNANQITLQDGVPGVTNQYLFQPIAGAFYAPCADGDLDAAIYGHEYTHAISNRMVAGPDSGLSGPQAGAMGESWSDQVAVEYLNAFNYVPTSKGENPFAVGIYATGNKKTAIRNYGMNNSPLNYSDIGYDITGPQVHADGEIWSATGYDIRQALVRKYNDRYPAGNERLQKRCADGNLPADKCPGNRRWIQIMFDAFLLQESDTSMLTARDAYLAADLLRFNGANQKVLWDVFAKRGFGIAARTDGTADDQPKPSFESPYVKEGTMNVRALALSGKRAVPVSGTLYLGEYEARATPVADTDPNTKLPARVRMVPGTYRFLFRAEGHGLNRFMHTAKAGVTYDRDIHVTTNMASKHNGAVIDGASDNLNAEDLIDDTEATNWAGLAGGGNSVDETHPYVNVNLAGGKQLVRSVKVSALLRPVRPTGENDTASGSRFTALRQFAIEVCTQDTDTDCGGDAKYRRIYTSPADAFDAGIPRPLAPNLLFRRFDVPDTQATHVRLVALENQCTGYAGYAGEQDNDEANPTDCKSGSTRDESVRAAELEVFAYDFKTRPPGDPVVVMTMKADPAVTASPGERVRYDMTYTNLGPKPSSYARITVDRLPLGLRFVSSNEAVVQDGRKLVWRLGKVPVDATDTVRLTTRVSPNAAPGTVLLTQAQFTGQMTFSPPAAAVTVVGP